MKQIKTALLLLAVLLMVNAPLCSFGESVMLPFSDVHSNDWYYDSVQYVYEHRIMTGISADEFSPDQNVSRAMMVTVLYRMSGESTDFPAPFEDVSSGAWYADAVAWAAEHNIVNGITDSLFAPEDDVTREQMAAILYRYANYRKYDTVFTRSLNEYEDASQLHSWSSAAVRWACAAQILHGTGDIMLEPESSASRAQTAAILQRLEQYENSGISFPSLTSFERYQGAFDALASRVSGNGELFAVSKNTTIQQGEDGDELIVSFVLDENIMSGESKELLLRLRRNPVREIRFETRLHLSLDREYNLSAEGTIDRRSLVLWDDVNDGPSGVTYNEEALQSENMIGVYYLDQYTQILLNAMMGDVDDYLTGASEFSISDLGLADDERLQETGPVSLSLFFQQ